MFSQEEQWLLSEKYKGEKTKDFFADCERLKNGESLAYIIGSIPFLNTTIFLDSHPLIPRAETEFWVEKAITEIKDARIQSPKILDLCAGSGCIGVAVLNAIPDARVDFIEIDTNHLLTIEKNCIENGIEKDRYSILISDLFSSRSDLELKYDFILSNPPYIDDSLERTDQSVLVNEPHLALFGGTGGLELIERIIIESKKHLTVRGILYIEHEPEQKDAIHKLASKNGLVVVTHTDQYNRERFSKCTVS